MSILGFAERLCSATVILLIAGQTQGGLVSMSSIATSTYTSGIAESSAISRGYFALVSLGTVVAAVVANTLFYFIGAEIVAYDPEFVVLANVSGTIIFTLFPAIVAVLLYAALLRFTDNPVRNFTIIAAVVFVVSVIPDVTYIPSQPGATSGQTAILVLMHAIAAIVIVGMLTTLTRSRGR
jgi:hypothetical protein